MNELNKLELKISRFLRFGVIFAGILMAIGWPLNMNFLSTNPFFVYSVHDPIPLQELLQLHLHNQEWGQLMAYLGLIILISLPIIRVFLTGILFIKQSERILALVAGLVFFFLILSFSLGLEI